jgi:hypothetical protein
MVVHRGFYACYVGPKENKLVNCVVIFMLAIWGRKETKH